MTVKELIKKLEKCPSNTIVYIKDHSPITLYPLTTGLPTMRRAKNIAEMSVEEYPCSATGLPAVLLS